MLSWPPQQSISWTRAPALLRASFRSSVARSMLLLPEPNRKKDDGSDNLTIELVDRTVTLRDWWTAILNQSHSSSESSSQQQQQGETVMPLLDLRHASSWEQKRLAHPRLSVVPIPMDLLKERSFELPARHLDFSILVDQSNLEDAQNFLVGPRRGRSDATSCPTRPKKPWQVTHVLIAGEDLWEQARFLGILHSDHSIMTPTITNNIFLPHPRLWQPDPMVQNILLPLLKTRSSHGRFQIWDLASGAGRDVAFLAEELKAHGNIYHVCGMDHRYNEREKNITQGFWNRRGLESVTKCIKIDLSTWDSAVAALEPAITSELVAALFCVRFWKPSLVSTIARSSKILPETIFGISHFCKAYEGASWDFDHPSRKTVLERTQLRDLFQGSCCNWEILHDEITTDSDHGRPMIQFVARRKANMC